MLEKCRSKSELCVAEKHIYTCALEDSSHMVCLKCLWKKSLPFGIMEIST